jgi:hypothetical protein
MPTKVKEIRSPEHGDRGACPICAPKKDRIPEWKVWLWAQTSGVSPWKR